MAAQTQNTRIFVVEDDPIYQRMIKYLMEFNPDHEVHVFSTGQECLQQLDKQPNIISLDYSLPDMTGEEVLRKIKAANQDIHVLILSGQQDIATAVKLLKNGAFDYITKDSETKDRLLNAIRHIKDQKNLKEEVNMLREELEVKYEFGNSVIGNSSAMQPVFRMMKKAAQSNITVSLYGATGTGKEVVAKSIHFNSPRQKGPFIPVNMGAIPRELVESELFGHEKGAFTGAIARKKGHFELANGGTLFLDEVAEMDLSAQTKLLRALQEREIIRVGGEKPIPFDARIIIATHKDLGEEVRKGRFREDLYYRLLGLNIKLPLLMERGNDILLLAQAFLDRFTNQNGMGKMSIAKLAKNKLMEYSYPGNVRELKAIMELAAVLANDQIIQEEDIQFNSIQREAGFLTQELTLEAYKNLIIKSFLDKYNDDVMLVAKKLDIGKSTIYRMLKEERVQVG
ncbi:MAG: sigma-54-dependent Fis family transcriptional regulator [Saprospiraceae bacterium]|nr:sigma-54-dependent Fis family transcriptional regulator [Saprospiraceae bacterium]